MISIIIPVYRSEETILRCLQSIEESSQIAQVPVEAVIVFDGPDAATTKKVDHFGNHTRIQVTTHHQPHGGIAAARNTGIQLASHEVLTFLDADDEITPDRLAFARTIAPATIAIGHQQLADPTKLLPGLHASQQGQRTIPYVTSLVTTRERLQALGPLDESLTLGDDWDLLLRARRSGIDIQFLDQIWTIRHVNESNASHQTSTLAGDYLAGIRQHIRTLKTQDEGQQSKSDHS